MRRTPKGLRLHIALFGRRNVGKSSLLNALTRQKVSIVSEHAGTTTDPVEKAMELLPLGPVLFIDTAGLDDTGALGELRVLQTKKVFERTDMAVLVCDSQWGEWEIDLMAEFKKRKTPIIVVFNKIDQFSPSAELLGQLQGEKIPYVQVSVLTKQGLPELRQALLDQAPAEFIENPILLSDLITAGEMVILVVPLDKEAPKGRLILPQVQAIRDILDNNSCCVVTQVNELKGILNRLKTPPQLVVTDSQAFLEVAMEVPETILMTSFSVLFSRFKGDLQSQAEGAWAISKLRPGSKVLIAESCSHHPISDDIGRVKIPRWLNKYVGGELDFTFTQGRDFPDQELSSFELLIHCGGCMWNRRQMLSRLCQCQEIGLPATNYGLAIAFCLGLFARALKPFPAVYESYLQYQKHHNT